MPAPGPLRGSLCAFGFVFLRGEWRNAETGIKKKSNNTHVSTRPGKKIQLCWRGVERCLRVSAGRRVVMFHSGCTRLVPLLRDPQIHGCPCAGPAGKADPEPRDRAAIPARSSSPAPTALLSGSAVLGSINWALTFLHHCLLWRCLDAAPALGEGTTK